MDSKPTSMTRNLPRKTELMSVLRANKEYLSWVDPIHFPLQFNYLFFCRRYRFSCEVNFINNFQGYFFKKFRQAIFHDYSKRKDLIDVGKIFYRIQTTMDRMLFYIVRH